MLFPTITFALFFLIVYTASWLLMPRLRLWKWFIIAASYVFYGWWDWRLVLLLVAATFVNQAFGVAVFRARGRRSGAASARFWLTLAVIANLAALGYFKYMDFFAASLDDLLGRVGLGAPLPLLHVVLPVGISFLVFRMLTYVVDIYRGQLEPAATLDYGVYVAFFPYLLAGPIARAREFLPQLRTARDPHTVDAGRAFFLILGGLAKKMLIADYLATHIVNGVFSSPQQYSSWETLVGIVAYSVQIYCDFSAYSDIAIGIALLLGFELPLNFNAPYTARTIQDFWRRWHITLSSWLRDYLYIPLGGNRKGRRRTALNLILTFLLGGLWHGAGWNFVFWGGMHGVGLALEHARADTRRRQRSPRARSNGRRTRPAAPRRVRLREPRLGVLPRRLYRRRLLGPVAAGRGARQHGHRRDLADHRPHRPRDRHPVHPDGRDGAPAGRVLAHRLGGPGRRAGARPVPDPDAGPAGPGGVPLLQVLSRESDCGRRRRA